MEPQERIHELTASLDHCRAQLLVAKQALQAAEMKLDYASPDYVFVAVYELGSAEERLGAIVKEAKAIESEIVLLKKE